jgi:hypothetical protein
MRNEAAALSCPSDRAIEHSVEGFCLRPGFGVLLPAALFRGPLLKVSVGYAPPAALGGDVVDGRPQLGVLCALGTLQEPLELLAGFSWLTGVEAAVNYNS